MHLLNRGALTGAELPASSEACHDTSILVQHPGQAPDGPCVPQPSAAGSSPDSLRKTANDSGSLGASFPQSASSALFWRLALVIGLTLPMLVMGIVLFIKGFFLSRDDLPYISNGRALPFPPLFPHLNPAPLHLNKDEGVYYVHSSHRTPHASGLDKQLQGDETLTPLDLGTFLAPGVELASKEMEECHTTDFRSSWVSVTPFDRVVILLIDAMRFDFALWDPEMSNACGNGATSECQPASPGLRPLYRNRLPFVHDLLRRSDAELRRLLASLLGRQEALDKTEGGNGTIHSQAEASSPSEAPRQESSAVKSNSTGLSPLTSSWGGNHFTRLYVFEADPPTATTQRLTAIATGSMPSFFSVRESFSASPVNVDSILMQFKAACKITIAIGDDTWKSTFGHLLSRTHVFPSLNIQDLHTVDDGVKAELPRQFAMGDWSFLVGHALGVDHVGHAAVLDSELMQKKLTEVDAMLKEALKMILNEGASSTSTRPLRTLFLTFGDHGMTEAGAHGGSSSEEVDAAFLAFSTLPAFLSPRAAQELSPATRLVESRLPAYLQGHGAFRDSNGRRTVGWAPGFRSSSPTPALGYGSLRVRQVGLAPTLSLLMGLPIPFNSMGQVMADLVPSLSSFVQECAPAVPGNSGPRRACATDPGKPCNMKAESDEAAARTVRCSDLAYLTQLYHITAWQQHRAIMTQAAVTGNDSVLTDSQFAAAKSRWLKLYFSLDKEIKALPAGAHVPLTQGTPHPTTVPSGPEGNLALPRPSSEMTEEELLFLLSRLPRDASEGRETQGPKGQISQETGDVGAASVISLLPSLIPYLLASADFSQELLQASVRQLGTFNLQLMLCATFLTLSSFLILVFAATGLRQPTGSRLYQTPKALIAQGLPEPATIARWLGCSACIGGAIWMGAWAFSEILKHAQMHQSLVSEAFIWHQLPVLCVAGALCSLIVPFGRCVLGRFLHTASRFRLLVGANGEAERLVLEEEAGRRAFIPGPRWKLCLSCFYLDIFGGGKLLSCFSMIILCIVPFSDCLVDRECAVVRFLISIFCVSAGLATFATPPRASEQTRIVSACAALMLCVRVGSAFDPSESPGEGEGIAGWPLMIDSMSSAGFLMFCIFWVAGKKDLPFVCRLFGPAPSDNGVAPVKFPRFQVLNFQLRNGQGFQKPRPCTRERVAFLIQGAIALLWFASPHESKSQQSSSQSPQQAHFPAGSPLYRAVSWLWSAAVLPFDVVDAIGRVWIARLTPSKPWMFFGPHWLVEALPAQLKEENKVKLLPLLNVFLPWVVYVITTGIWLGLVLALCRMKKRENVLSMVQLRRAEAELPVLENELSSCSQVDESSQRALGTRPGGMFFHVWRVEVWEYFSHYFLLTALCPLCLYAMLLGKAQLWPLLLCCVKWRLLVFLSRVRVMPPSCAFGQNGGMTCQCCFCRAAAAVPSDASTACCPKERKSTTSKVGVNLLQGEPLRFLLSDTSVCMLAALLAFDTFFATGHRTKLSALPIEAGFIGLLEFHPVLSVVTSFLHTYLVYMICCPLIFMIVFLRLTHAAAAGNTADVEELQGSTVDAVVQSTLVKVGKLAFGILIGITLRHLCSLISLTVLRNHLFIWELFAVKFLYDATAVCLTYLLVVLTLFFVCIGARRTPTVLRLPA